MLCLTIGCVSALVVGCAGGSSGIGGTHSSSGGGTVAPSQPSTGGTSLGGAIGQGGSAKSGGSQGLGGSAGSGGSQGLGGSADAQGGSAGSKVAVELDPTLPPSINFDLRSWKLTVPDGSERSEAWLAGGGQEPGVFFTDPLTGGMVFRVPNLGGTTSGSSYSRSELREMLRAGNESVSTQGITPNNWVFSSSSVANQNAAGGIDGTLTATLRVDHVSTSGDANKIGRIIVGQIHASNNEPCRLYYRKLPGNVRGAVYFAYEPNIGDEQFIEMIGSRSDSASDPADGIGLNEAWSYKIDAHGNVLTVTVQRPNYPDVVATTDMTDGGLADDWMYFKAGAYNQNNTGSEVDFAQVTFFAIKNTHD